MATLNDKIIVAFDTARRINEALWMGGVDSSYMSIDELRDHVEQSSGVSISFKLLDVETRVLFGFIERYDDGKSAIIYIVKNIPPRWRPLVAAKEICHVALDEPEDWNADGQDTLQRLVTVILDIDAPENRALRSEQIAELIAWELLYPHELRQRDLHEFTEGRLSFAMLAARYRLPEQIIEDILSPPYLAMCDKYWAIVHAQHQAGVMAAKAAS